MMCLNVVLFVIFLNTIYYSIGERRITNGKRPKEPKRYIAYLVKAPEFSDYNDSWLCGGAIVTPLYIVTSAACILNVQRIYAVAGYDKYVRSQDIHKNKCTSNKKKKVVSTCVPRTYNFNNGKIDDWALIDIGVAQVESPYDFTDKSYESLCTHIPTTIPINFESKYQELGTDALVFGWGHAKQYRDPEDYEDYNTRDLLYTTTRLTFKEDCKETYGGKRIINETIDKFMICTDGVGNIDAEGELIVRSKLLAVGCANDDGLVYVECDDEGHPIGPYEPVKHATGNPSTNGICQNDHGGPLVTWMGKHEILIGVASMFMLDSKFNCVGPYLFTSTHCNGGFLDCIINGNRSDGRRSNCDGPTKARGFDIMRRTVSWSKHPDRPAANEIIRLRPQLPIRRV